MVLYIPKILTACIRKHRRCFSDSAGAGSSSASSLSRTRLCRCWRLVFPRYSREAIKFSITLVWPLFLILPQERLDKMTTLPLPGLLIHKLFASIIPIFTVADPTTSMTKSSVPTILLIKMGELRIIMPDKPIRNENDIKRLRFFKRC